MTRLAFTWASVLPDAGVTGMFDHDWLLHGRLFSMTQGPQVCLTRLAFTWVSVLPDAGVTVMFDHDWLSRGC